MQQNHAFLFIMVMPEKEIPLDLGYGDSDVYIYKSGSSCLVAKHYDPVRMLQNVAPYLEEDNASRVLVLQMRPKLRAFLGQLDPQVFASSLIGPLLDQYRKDTHRVMEMLNSNPDVYTQHFNGLGVESIEFTVIPQGGSRQGSTMYGQTFVPGKNWLQWVDPSMDLYRSHTVSSQQESVPSIFREAHFMQQVLREFSYVLAHHFADLSPSFEEYDENCFPVFHGVHPLNTILSSKGDGRWVVNVTDLSVSLCIDYALVLSGYK